MYGMGYDVARSEHAERIREAERFRRAKQARSNATTNTAAQRERRFSFFRFPFVRPSQA